MWSDLETVLMLATPQNPALTINADAHLVATWDAVTGADMYRVFPFRNHNVVKGERFDFANANFSSVHSTGTPARPEESEFYFETVEQMPGWTFVLPATVAGGYGFMDNDGYTTNTGYAAQLQSYFIDCTKLKDNQLNIEVEVLAGTATPTRLACGLFHRDPATGDMALSPAAIYNSENFISNQFEKLSFSLKENSAECMLLFQTLTEKNQYGLYPEGSLFFRSIRVWGEADTDFAARIPLNTVTVEAPATTAEIVVPLVKDDTYEVQVQAIQTDKRGYYIAAVSDLSESATVVSDVDGISTIANDGDTEATYFNLQGMPVANPAKGTVVIRRQGNRAEKVLVK